MIDTLVADFRAKGNSVYPEISVYYRKLRNNWFRHVSRYVHIDLDTWASDFEETLYRSLLQFNPDYDPEQPKSDRFSHYFSSAVNKLATGLKRKYMSEQCKAERKSICVHGKDMEIEDKRRSHECCLFELMDCIDQHTSGFDREVLSMRLEGYEIPDICSKLNISKRNYWSRVYRLRSKIKLVREVECV